ncbi:MAG: 50S ribosomal protein L25, partial [Patescibacteria group bacterium]
HELQHDYLSDEIIAADFFKVRLDEKIKVRVPIEFRGVAPAVKDLGGIFVKAMQEVEVEALPNNLPQSLVADLGSIKEIGQSLYVKDLPIPADVRVLVAPETVVATVSAQVTEEQEIKEAATVDVSAIKSETEEKKAERDVKKAAGAPAAEAPKAEGKK